MRAGSSGRRLGLTLFLLTGIIPLCLAWLALTERARRLDVLAHGEEKEAEVISAQYESSGRLGTCMLEYAFDMDGYYTTGESMSCRLMRRYPEGSRIRIRVDPKDPEAAMVVGESAWSYHLWFPVVAIPLWLLAGWAALWPVRRSDRDPRHRAPSG